MHKPRTHRAANPGMELDSAIAALTTMPYTELREAWQRLFRSHPPKKLIRDLLELVPTI